MRLSRKIIAPVLFLAAGGLAVGGATVASGMIEQRSASAVTDRLAAEGVDFTAVRADGLAVHLTGTAPNEAARFRAVNLAGSVIDPSRIRDEMEVVPVRAVEAPDFSVEMLRNDGGVSLIGLIPDSGATGGAAHPALEEARALLGGEVTISDMLETAAYPAPEGWDAALTFGLEALKILPRSKISVMPDRVEVTAISDSAEAKRDLEAHLARLTPQGLATEISISAPRPVLTPFTLRFVKDQDGARFDACAADTEAARDRITAAGRTAGIEGDIACTVGLGVPSTRWADATEAAIAAIATLGSGSVTFSDADVTLTGTLGTAQGDFDRVVGALQSSLPEVFSLTATLPEPAEEIEEGPTEFTASLSPEGAARIQGRVKDALSQSAVDSFARAQFGADRVDGATLVDPEIPRGWSIRVLAGLEALAVLESGDLTVRPDVVQVSGRTGSKLAGAQITQILSDKLGRGQQFEIAATYDEDLDPNAALPAPAECVARLNAIMAANKIVFAPGSAEIDSSARETLTGLTDVLMDCPHLSFEIQGYTDSQGSEGGNRALSQARAEAVQMALQGRRVPVARLAAMGYGEADPIADNGTEAGREANRRIEFELTEVAPDPNAAPAEQAAAVVQQLEERLFPEGEEELLRIPADQVDGSGDGDPAATEDQEGADQEGGDQEAVDADASFAPTEMTLRPEPRPED